MSESDKQLLRDITGALSKAIVVVVRALEAQSQGAIERQSVIVALDDAARAIPANSTNDQITRTILGNIAAELERGNRHTKEIPL